MQEEDRGSFALVDVVHLGVEHVDELGLERKLRADLCVTCGRVSVVASHDAATATD